MPVAVKAIARLGRGLVSLTEPRFLRYDMHMAFSLRDLRLNGVQHELLLVAACCKHGLAETVPIDDEKRLSLPAAIAVFVGLMPERNLSNNFDELLDNIPANKRANFIRCWEAIEMFVGEDIVDWSERVGSQEAYKTIKSLAGEVANANLYKPRPNGFPDDSHS